MGDQIVAVNGQPIPRPANMQEAQRLTQTMIGQASEEQVWAAQGLAEGATITLTVRRRRTPGAGSPGAGSPGAGWQTFDVTGPLREEQIYRDTEQRRALAPGGPGEMARDGFDDTWASRYERRVTEWSRALGGRWWQKRPDTRQALKSHLEDAARVQALAERYPGPFAESVKGDWEKVRARLDGTVYTISAADLGFRELQEERARTIAQAARAAWAAYQAACAPQSVPAFPGVDPVRGDRSQLTGKLVVLPPIAPDDWIVDMGTPYLASGQGACWYVAAVQGGPLRQLFLAAERFKRHVTPDLRETVTLVGQVLPEPRLVVTRSGAVPAFQVEPVAALMGESVFVDLAAQAAPEGASPEGATPEGATPEGATPREVPFAGKRTCRSSAPRCRPTTPRRGPCWRR